MEVLLMWEAIDSAINTVMGAIINALVAVVSFIVSNPFLRVFTYLLLMNLAGFILMKRDKEIAKRNALIEQKKISEPEDMNKFEKYLESRNRKRIKESTLLVTAMIGGSLGVLGGMYAFNHKTKKPKFKIGVPVIIGLQVVLILYVVIKLTFFNKA